MPFADRADAGRRLATRLAAQLAERGPAVVVLGLPRGGVPVAFEVARALDARLDVIVVRKLGVPAQPELGMGAIGEDGVRIINAAVVRAAGVDSDELGAVELRERAELDRRAQRFRPSHQRVALSGRTAVVVDDGIATGSTARAAAQVARAQGASRVILAVPLAPADAVAALRADFDDVVCLETPSRLFAIGQWYQDFSQTSDDEVVSLLARARARARARVLPEGPEARDEEVVVPAGTGSESGLVALPGRLTVPAAPHGMVIFAHGSGSSRLSPRNGHVAGVLNQAGLGTLLFDLLSDEEASDRGKVFDVGLLAGRLADATFWLRAQPGLDGLATGYFGASTGAAAALGAAARSDTGIGAVVSRGGRPDLAGARLGEVRAPTLLIVGARDVLVVEFNRLAQAYMTCEARLEVIPQASHLFEEPGTLEVAAQLARDWFLSHLS